MYTVKLLPNKLLIYTVKLLSNKCLCQVVIVDPVELLFTTTMLLLIYMEEKQPQLVVAVAVKGS